MRQGVCQVIWNLVVLLIVLWLTVGCTMTSTAHTMTVQLSSANYLAGAEVASQEHQAYFQFMLAVRDELSKDVNGAVEKYARALEADPSSPYLHARLAVMHAGKNNHDEALAHVDAALKQPDIAVNTQILLGDILVKMGLLDRAVELYDTVIQRQVGNPDVFVKKGVLLVSLNQFEAAKEALGRGIELRPDLPIAYYYLGHVALAQQQSEKAIKSFERAIAGKQDFLPAYLALAKVHEEYGAISEAIGIYRTALKTLGGSLPVLRSELIRLYLKEKTYEPALALLEDVLREDPHNLEATLRVGLIYVAQKKFKKAAARLQVVLEQRSDDVMVRDYLGLVFEQSERYDAAIQQYLAVLEINDQYLDTIFHLGHLYYQLKQFDASVPLLRKAVQLAPEQINSYLVLALSLTQLKRYVEAVAILEEGIVQHSEIPDLHYHLGIVHDKLDQDEGFIAQMEETVRLDPNHAEALNYLGYFYVEQGIKLPEAMGLIERAVFLQPDNGYYLDSLAWGHFKMGKVHDALVGLKQATRLAPDDPVIIQHLGEVYLTLGRRDEAKKAWLRSLDLNPDNPVLREALQTRGLSGPHVEEGI